MSILLKEYPIIPFGRAQIEVKELTIGKLRKAKKNMVNLGQNFLRKLNELEKMNADSDEIATGLDQILDVALDMPYEVCKILIPEITKEQVEEATTREVINLVNTALEVNGFFMMKDKIGKMFRAMR